MGVTLFRKNSSTRELKSQKKVLLETGGKNDVGMWMKPQSTVVPIEGEEHIVTNKKNEQSSFRFPNKKKGPSFRLPKFTQNSKNRKEEANIMTPSRIGLLDNQKASDVLTPLGNKNNNKITPPTRIMNILDSSQQTSLSPERRQFLTESRTPKKPYRRYDDTAEDDPCFLDDYDEFVSLFSSTNIATVKTILFEGRKGTIKPLPTEKLNDIELLLQSFDVSCEHSDFPLDETETIDSSKKDSEEYYASNDQRQPSNTLSLVPEPSIRRQLSGTFDEIVLQSDHSLSMPNSSSNIREEIYGDIFTASFLKTMTNVGKNLLLFVKGKEKSSNWRCAQVLVKIVMNKTHCAKFHRLQLRITLIQSRQQRTVSFNLMDILSIKTTKDKQDACFTIVTEIGEVYLFEAASVSEKNILVNGLKNTISRFSFHIISGSMTTKQSLSKCNNEEENHDLGEPPSLKTSSQTLQDITMQLLK